MVVRKIPNDFVWQADMDYSREAAAYNHLEAAMKLQLPGFAPRYYGSWTFELPVTGNRRRAVRLILIEYIL
ncbi:hypothetical protein ANO14919_134490 [Xylariales sp. No.14919]|nr:hypothetical protein F5X98DRAFT_301136 [Xylaria grammica]GAW23872.1 hypothetical protein ANO14919_134490 [Xylariales sp. No.14919]